MTGAVAVGTAVVALIDPHPGAARDFNRWYERDHYYAAAMAGPGMCAGARWVATTRDRALRVPGGWFGSLAPAAYLATYWVLSGMQAAWDDWAATQYASFGPDRLFTARDHVHTAVYDYMGEAQVAGAPPPITALDHPFPGVTVVATTASPDVALDWAGGVVHDDVPLAVALRAGRTILTTTDPPPFTLLLLFGATDPHDAWHHHVAPALGGLAQVGFAGPFRRTVPGTDRYTDEL